MKEFKYTITDAEGIHARPAGELVKAAKAYNCAITMHAGEKSGDCKKIFALMGMGVKKDADVTIVFDGEDEAEAFEAISAFMKENL